MSEPGKLRVAFAARRLLIVSLIFSIVAAELDNGATQTAYFNYSHGGKHRASRRSHRHYSALSQVDHLEIIRKSIPLFENQTLIVCAVVREPFVIYNANEQQHKYRNETAMEQESNLDNYSGVAIEVIKRLAYIFKFKVKLTRPDDNQFGIYLADRNKWTGLMGALTRRQADIGVTALSITMSRAQAIDFTRAYYVETVAILLRTPEEVQNYLAIFEPFSFGIWLILLATILLLILLITIMTKLEDEQAQQEKRHKLARMLIKTSSSSPSNGYDDDDQDQDELQAAQREQLLRQRRLTRIQLSEQLFPKDHNRDQQQQQSPIFQDQSEFGTTWLERFYYAVSCVLNILLIRDIKHPPHQTPIRILVCVWWLSTIVIVNIYLGILFGQLVIPRRPKSIETLEELVNQQQIDWCVTSGSAIYELFRQSEPTSVYGQLGQRMKLVASADEGVERVVKSGWAFIRERSILTFKVAQEHNRLKACRMQFGKEDFYSVGFGIGLAKGSRYLEPFNSALTLMIENGFFAHWQEMYWPKRNQYTECKLQPTEGQPLSIKHFISIYLVCSLIVASSAVILVYQNIHEHLIVGLKKKK